MTALFAVILLGFVLLMLRVPADPGAALAGLVPRFEGAGSVLLATGILGATVMPHAIYLHSALVPEGAGAGTVRQRRIALSGQRSDVLSAMGLAGLVNGAMLHRCCRPVPRVRRHRHRHARPGRTPRSRPRWAGRLRWCSH